MTFFFTFVFMFFVFWRPQEWLAPWLYGVPMLDVVVFTALLALLIETDQGRVWFPRGEPQVFMLIGLWFAAAMSHAVNTYFAGMIATIQEVFKFCLFTLLLYCVVDRPSRLRAFAALFVFMAVLMAVHAHLQVSRGEGFANSRPMWIPPFLGRPGMYRTTFFGIFSDPNDLAQMLAAAMPLVFAIPRRMGPVGFLLCAAIAVFLYTGFETTHSRGGLVALISAAGILVGLRLPRRWVIYYFGFALIGILLICRFKGGVLIDASARERLEFWGYGNWAFKQHPLFGVGYGMYWLIGRGRPAHNAFVTCYAELGLFGYWLWFGFLLLGVIGTWRSRVRLGPRRREDPEIAYTYRFSGLVLSALGGFAASAYFLSRTFVYPFLFLMAVVNAVPRVTQSLLPDDPEPLLNTRRDVLGYVTLGTLASVVYVYLTIVLLNKSQGMG